MHAIVLAQSGAITLGSAFVRLTSASQRSLENKCVKAPFDIVDDKDNLHYKGTA